MTGTAARLSGCLRADRGYCDSVSLNMENEMEQKQLAANALEKMILETELDLDEVAARWAECWPTLDSEVLAEIWVEVMSNMPELN